MNIHGVFLHVIGDALGSIGAMVNALVLWLSTWEDRFILDPLISIVIVAILVVQTLPLVVRSARVLMMESPEGIDLPSLQQQIEAISGVSGVHDLHVWQLSQKKFVGSVHILVDTSPSDYPAISRRILNIFHESGVHMSTCQPEFPVSTSSAEGERRESAAVIPEAPSAAPSSSVAASAAAGMKCRLVCPNKCQEYMAGYMVGNARQRKK
jgi:zinc transporter 1